MKKAILHIAVTVLGALLFSCTKESDRNTYSEQDTLIEDFVNTRLSALDSAYAVVNKGSQRIVVKEGGGEPLATDGTVSFYYAGYILTRADTLNAASMFATNNIETAEAAGWELSGDTMDILTLNLADTDIVEGLRNGLAGVKGGEECFILFSGKHGFGKRQTGTIPAKSPLIYHIWVESISNE